MDKLIIPKSTPLTVNVRDENIDKNFTSISQELLEIVWWSSQLAMKVLTNVPIDWFKRGKEMFKNVSLHSDFSKENLRVMEILWESDNAIEIQL